MSSRLRRPLLLSLGLLLSACGGSGATSGVADEAGFQLIEASIGTTQNALKAGTIGCAGLVAAYLERIETLDRDDSTGPALNSVLAAHPEAMAQARALDAHLAEYGTLKGPLHCVPMLLKDNFDTVDMPTTAASRAIAGSQPADDAFTVQRLRGAGAVILGKTTMTEYAFFTQSHNSFTGRVGAAYDTRADAGGSSGGTASAVAANLALAGTGSDTCASIRLPPSNASLVGVRASMGLVSQDGIVPLSHFHDVGGPITRTVTDAARVLDVMAAVDPADARTLDPERYQPASYTAALNADGLARKRIGVLRSYGGTDAFGSDPAIQRIMTAAIGDIEAAGAEVIDPVTLPDFASVSVLVQEFETHINEYLQSIPEPVRGSLDAIILSGQVHPFIEAILVAAKTLSDTSWERYFATKGQRPVMRAYVEAEMDRLGLDALVYPPVLDPPFATLVDADAEALLAALLDGDSAALASNIDALTQGSNCGFSASTGLPSIVVPAGFTEGATPLPVGLEIFGRKWDEASLFEIAYAFEQATHHRHPPPAYTPTD